MKRALTAAFAILVLVLASKAEAEVSDPVHRLSNDPANGYAVVDANGNSHVVDSASRNVLVTDAYGRTYAVPLSQAANEAADGDVALGTAMAAETMDFITNQNLVYTLTGSTQPRLAITGDEGGGTFDPESSPRDSGADIGAVSGVEDWLGGPCDLGPCSPYQRATDHRFYYMMDQHSGTVGKANEEMQRRYAEDYEQWQRMRAGACQDMRDSMMDATLAGGAVVASCPAVLSPSGAVACAASLVGYVVLNGRAARHARTCASSYPGPGRW